MNQKKEKPAAAFVILGLSIMAAAGIRTFLRPCVHEDGSFGSCHWAGQVLFGVSLLMAFEAMLAILQAEKRPLRVLYLCLLGTALLGFCVPGHLIKLCSMDTMRCQSIMRPAMQIIFCLAAIVSFLGFVFTREKKDRSRSE